MLLIGMVEILIRRIVAVIGDAGIGALFVAALVDPPPGEGSAQVLADAEGHAEAVRRLFPESQDILLGTDVDAVHAVDFRAVIEEVVVVGALGHQVAGTGLVIPVGQGFRIEVFRFPEGADVLVAEFGRVAVMADMVFILGGSLHVHITGVPVTEHGDALGAPVAPDAEFGVPEPFRGGIGAEGFEGWIKMLRHRGASCICSGFFSWHQCNGKKAGCQ